MSDHTAHAIQTESCQVTKLTPELADMIPGVNYVEGSSQTVRVCGPGITSGPEIPRWGGPGPVMSDDPIPPVLGPVVSSKKSKVVFFSCKDHHAHVHLDGSDGDVFELTPKCSEGEILPLFELFGDASLTRATILFSSQINTIEGVVEITNAEHSSLTDVSVDNASLDCEFMIGGAQHSFFKKIKLANITSSSLYIHARNADVTLDNVSTSKVPTWLTRIDTLRAQNVHFKNMRFLLSRNLASLISNDVNVEGLISFEENITIHPGDSNNQSALFNAYITGHTHFSVKQVKQVPEVDPNLVFGYNFVPVGYKLVVDQSEDFLGKPGDLCAWLRKIKRSQSDNTITTNATTADGKPCVVHPQYSTTGGSVAVSVFAVCGVMLGVCAALVMAVVGDHRRGRKTSTEKAI